MNACACGCGLLVTGTWKQGHNPKTKGRTFTEEHRRRISESRKGKRAGTDHPQWGRPLAAAARLKLSEANRGKVMSDDTKAKISATKLAQRTSDSPGAIHVWLLRHHPKTGFCEHCGAQGRTHFASLTGHQYTRNREDYAELCPACHMIFDDAPAHRPGLRVDLTCGRCGQGYSLTPSQAAKSKFCSQACRLAALHDGNRKRAVY